MFEATKVQSQMVSNILKMAPHQFRNLIKGVDDGGHDDDDEVTVLPSPRTSYEKVIAQRIFCLICSSFHKMLLHC